MVEPMYYNAIWPALVLRIIVSIIVNALSKHLLVQSQRDTRKRGEMSSKLTIKTIEQRPGLLEPLLKKVAGLKAWNELKLKKSKDTRSIENFNLFNTHSVRNICIQSFSGPDFPTFGLNTDQKNFEYGQFSHSDYYQIWHLTGDW